MLRAIRLILTLSVLFAIGCDSSGNSRVTEYVFNSEALPIHSMPIVVRTYHGDIDVVDDPTVSEAQIDLVRIGAGDARASAVQDGYATITATTVISDGKIFVAVGRTDGQATGHALLHLRVPNGAVLDLTTDQGNINVAGPVGTVKAGSRGGNIAVRGAGGSLDLTAQNGSVIVDGGSQQLVLRAASDITIYAKDVTVTAHSTAGRILFVGRLSSGTSTFDTSSDQDIMIALPDRATFNMDAKTTNNLIISDFPNQLKGSSDWTPICGKITARPPHSYRPETGALGQYGQVAVKMITSTDSYSATLTDTYYRFDTSLSDIAFIRPAMSAIHADVGPDTTILLVDDLQKPHNEEFCTGIVTNPPQLAPVTLKLSTGGGRIRVQHMQTK